MAGRGKAQGGLREGANRFRAAPRTGKAMRKPAGKEGAAAGKPDNIGRIFMNGRSQAVRLPKKFRLPGDRVRVRREGDAIVLEPIKSLDDILDEIHRLTKGRFPKREQPPMPDDDEELSWD